MDRPVPSLMRAAAVALAAAACTADVPPTPSDLTDVLVGGHRLRVELAVSPDQLERGLMHRRELPDDGGMLFVYPSAWHASLWMRDTYVPLSVAFLADDGRIVAIEDLAPFDETPRRSPEPVRYALEVNRGWFEAHGVEPGDRATFRVEP